MRTYALIILGCMLAFASCQHPWGPGGYKTWVATDPIQCLGNPWEQAWLEEHDGDYGAYPRDLEEQFKIIRAFYADMGVRTFSILTRRSYDIVCCACSCPAGYTLYLLVDDDDVPRMLELGYRVSTPYAP